MAVGLGGAPGALVVDVGAGPELDLLVAEGEVAEGLDDGTALDGLALGEQERALGGAVAPAAGDVVVLAVNLSEKI